MVNYTLKIINIKAETSDSLTIAFKQPGLKKIKYKAGQYLTLIFRINGRRYLRPYSLSSSPGVNDTLDITVKRIPGGIVSNYIFDNIRVGDIIESIGPLGKFVLPEEDAPDLQDKCIVLWGAGSGITPLISIIKYALNRKLFKHVILIYGNRHPETTIFGDEIRTLQDAYSGDFSVLNFYSQCPSEINNSYNIQGRIDPALAMDILKDREHKSSLHYICGPEDLKKTIKLWLSHQELDVEGILSEDFEVVRDASLLSEIATQDVILKKDDEITKIEVSKGKSILEAALDAMIDIDYSCQTGDCLLCKGKLVRGQVKDIGNKNIDELQQDECLLCCSFPLTNDVEIIIE